jgi:hypothetical protein
VKRLCCLALLACVTLGCGVAASDPAENFKANVDKVIRANKDGFTFLRRQEQEAVPPANGYRYQKVHVILKDTFKFEAVRRTDSLVSPFIANAQIFGYDFFGQIRGSEEEAAKCPVMEEGGGYPFLYNLAYDYSAENNRWELVDVQRADRPGVDLDQEGRWVLAAFDFNKTYIYNKQVASQ